MEMGRGVTDDHVLALAKRETPSGNTRQGFSGSSFSGRSSQSPVSYFYGLTGMTTAEKSGLVSRTLRKHGMEMTGCFTWSLPDQYNTKTLTPFFPLDERARTS
jgi:hypothetical protein